MIRLSVNVNKVATLRNSRGGDAPNVIGAVEACLHAGARGITVHPRLDERHIRAEDVRDVAARLRQADTGGVEYNIEGDPRPDWLELVREVVPHQATLVPVRPGEVTSEAGWAADTDLAAMQTIIADLKGRGIRVSVFVDPTEAAVRFALAVGADRIELYTEPFARAFARSRAAGETSFAAYSAVAQVAQELGLGINAGHDLDLDNLQVFKALPGLEEVSIGHALMARALFRGLEPVVHEYLALLGPQP